MNILYITPILPYPLHSGGQVRLYNLLKRLSRRHRIHLVSFIRQESERELLPSLSFLDRVDLFFRGRRFRPEYFSRSLIQNRSLLTSSYALRPVRRQVMDLVKSGSYDLIQVEPFYAFQFFEKPPVPLVVAEHNVEFRVYEDYAKTAPNYFLKAAVQREARLISREEQEAFKFACRLVTVSPEDRAYFSRFFPAAGITVVPNGVDTGWFKYETKKIPRKGMRILFTGNFAWHPNLEAVSQLAEINWQKLAGLFPGLKVTVVGQGATAKLKETLSKAGIDYRGSVADIRDAYRESQVFLTLTSVPGGSKYKCLEAMGSGVPVLSTAAGMAGLGARAGQEYLEVNSEGEIVSALKRLGEQPDLIRKMTSAARALIEEKFSWDKIAQIQEGVWEGIG